MSDPAPGPAPEWIAPPAPKPFSTVVTVICSIVAIVYIGLLGRPLIEPNVSPLATLERPAASLERLSTRELDLRAAMRGGVAWEWRLYRALSGEDDPLVEAAGWYEELIEVTHAPSARLYRAVLLAESGRIREATEEVARWPVPIGRPEPKAAWIAAAYLDPPPAPPVGEALIGEVRGELTKSWFADTLIARIASRIGDGSAQSHAQDAILARGRALLMRARVLMAVSALLLLLGVAAVIWTLARRRPARVADAPLPPVWSPAEGYALFVRCLGAPQAIALVAFVALRRETGLGSAIGMAADLPLFFWVANYLVTRDSSMRAAFGLWPGRRGWAPLVGTTLSLVAIALVADTAIELASSYFRLKTHWTDGFSEELLWSSGRRLALEALDASVWAPIVEELTFRGLLYGTLRTRLGVWSSAVLSAVIFTLPHGYALTGSVSVLMSGILWAIAYEKTRSLLPGLVAHATNNALSTVWTIVLLR